MSVQFVEAVTTWLLVDNFCKWVLTNVKSLFESEDSVFCVYELVIDDRSANRIKGVPCVMGHIPPCCTRTVGEQ